MIFDTIKNASTYYSLNEKIATALNYLEGNDLIDAKNGKYAIDGEDIFVIIQDYETKPLAQGKWESHKKYIDIQFIISGSEKIGCTSINSLVLSEKYDDNRDLVFYTGNGDFLTLHQNDFAIFYPQDAHMPCIALEEASYVKKAVVKIKI